MIQGCIELTRQIVVALIGKIVGPLILFFPLILK